MRLTRILVAAAFAAALAAPLAAQSQPAGSIQAINPLTRDLGALQTLTTQTAATLNSSDQNGFNVSRVVCVYQQSSRLNSPSTTFAIQNKDAASGTYYTLVTSSAVTSSTSPSAISAGAGVATTANVGAGIPIARTWRTTVTVGGTTPIVTGTVGCSVQ